MAYLGIDWGEKRIGLSYGDELGIAVPLKPAIEKSLEKRLDHITALLKERSVNTIVIGYPYLMNGDIGEKAKQVDRFIEHLKQRTTVSIHRMDERLTSARAQDDLRQVLGNKKMSTKSYRRSGDLDSRSAALILQDFLDQL